MPENFMKYELKNIYESMKDVQPEMGGVIHFEFEPLGIYLAKILNGGKPLTYEDAKRIEFPFDADMFRAFESKCKVKVKYPFNELRYFPHVKPFTSPKKYAPRFLNEVTIPDDWTEIPKDVFEVLGHHDSIKKINYTDKIVSFRDACFWGVKAENIYIPKTTVNIEEYAFKNVKFNEPAVVIPPAITEIPKCCFADTTGLLEEFVLPDTLKKIGPIAFSGSKIQRLTIPDSVTEMGGSAFKECKNLKEVKLSAGLTEIPNHCFAKCERLEHIMIPEGITTIREGAFRECYELKELEFPTTLNRIEKGALNLLMKLKKLVIRSKIDCDEDNLAPNWSVDFDNYLSIPEVYLPERMYSENSLFARVAEKVIYI